MPCRSPSGSWWPPTGPPPPSGTSSTSSPSSPAHSSSASTPQTRPCPSTQHSTRQSLFEKKLEKRYMTDKQHAIYEQFHPGADLGFSRGWGRILKKNRPKRSFYALFGKCRPKNCVFSARAPPSKLVNIGAKGAFRKILGSVSQKWISQNSTNGDPLGPPPPQSATDFTVLEKNSGPISSKTIFAKYQSFYKIKHSQLTVGKSNERK